MYLEHFELKEAPFSITPDPRFVFLTAQHRDAMAHLLFGITQGGGGGFVQLTGEVGTGKTTLCRLLIAQVPENVRIALVLNPMQQPIELLRTICDELRILLPRRNTSIKVLTDALTKYLLESYAAGLRVVVVLDEAQNLSFEALEQVRLLTNLETPTQKLLQVILLGQPELRAVLARDDLRQLAQRITARFHLAPLSSADTASYVAHRLAVAGRRRELFDAGALRELFRRTRGFPRSINVVADRALLGGYARGLATIDVGMVKVAASEVAGGQAFQPWRNAWLGVAVVSGAMMLAAWYIAPRVRIDSPAAASPAVATAASASNGAATRPLLPVDELRGFSDPAAAMGVVGRWWSAELATDGSRCQVASASARCARLRLNTHLLMQLDRPLVLELGHAGERKWIALRRLQAGIARVAGPQRIAEVDWSAIESRWLGEAWLVAERPEHYAGELIAPGAEGAMVDFVHSILQAIDAQPAAPSYDASSVERIRAVQQRFGLRPDGIVGAETMAVLVALRPGGPRLLEEIAPASFVSEPQR